MLEAIPASHSARQVFRLAYIPVPDVMTELEIDPQGQVELKASLAAAGYGSDAEDLCSGPFRRLRHLRNRTRFSDGSFPVFYASLDTATARAEVKDWFRRHAGTPSGRRTAYYQSLQCTFRGTEKDLRPKVVDWPDLIHPSDYTFCNEIGAEASEAKLDALVVASARCPGTNLPVFRRPALSAPLLGSTVIVTLDPSTGDVSVAI